MTFFTLGATFALVVAFASRDWWRPRRMLWRELRSCDVAQAAREAAKR